MSEQPTSKTLLCLIPFLLAGCGMSDENVRKANEACKAEGGDPVQMVTLYGAVTEVRCW